MPPYILDDLPKDDQKLIDTCGEGILEMMEGMGGVLMIEDDVVIETSIAEHYSDFDFMIAVFRGNLTYTNTFSEDDVHVVVLGEIRCPRIIQKQDFGVFVFRKAIVEEFAILRSTHGPLRIHALEASLLFVAACVYPQIKEITSDITIFNNLDEKVEIEKLNEYKVREYDIDDHSIFNDAFIAEFGLGEDRNLDRLIGPYSRYIDRFIEFLGKGEPFLK